MATLTDDAPRAVIPSTAVPVVRENYSFRNFAIVWALASLFHMAHSGTFDTRLNFALLTLAALYVVFKPSLSGFVALILLQLLDVALRMPDVTNHWLFTAFVNLTILQSILYTAYRRRTFDLDESEVYKTFAPVARVEVLILYGWAAFHKLNSGFFSPEASCASELLRAQHLETIILNFPILLELNAYITIVVELGILVMLCFGKTRNMAVMIGFLFHLVLSYSTYNAFFDFTSMIIAAYFLFTSPEFNKRVYQWFTDFRMAIKRYFRTYSVARMALVCVGIVVLMALLSVVNKTLDTFSLFHLYFFWTLYGLALMYLFVRFLFIKHNRDNAQPLFYFKNNWLMIIPMIVFLNGLSPYVGLKTENSYAMFSNLRTEGGVTNHYIVPRQVQIFGYQSDMVEFISSDDVKLQRLADEGQLMVLFEFRNYLRKFKGQKIVYRLNGKIAVFHKGETKMSGALAPNSPLLERLMNFRTVSKYEPQPCAH